MDNYRFKGNKKTTLAIAFGKEKESKLSVDHLQPFIDKLSNVEGKMRDVKFSQKMIGSRLENHFESSKYHNKTIMSYTIIETVIMILIFLFQFFYLRSLVKE